MYENRTHYAWTNHRYIAHAMGGLDGYDYSNSLEAFEANYQKGYRLFEVDFVMSSDHKLVALHYWENAPEILGTEDSTPLSQEEFLSKKIYGLYTPLSYEQVLQLMQKHPDIYIITDTKDTKDPEITKSFQYLYDVAKKTDIHLLDRIIPQIYNEPMYESIMKIHNWNSVIYTLYTQGSTVTDDSIVSFAKKNGIKVITTGQYRCDPEFFNLAKKNKIKVYMHTYNTVEEAQHFFDLGVHGFYSDDLAPT